MQACSFRLTVGDCHAQSQEGDSGADEERVLVEGREGVTLCSLGGHREDCHSSSEQGGSPGKVLSRKGTGLTGSNEIQLAACEEWIGWQVQDRSQQTRDYCNCPDK